MFTRTHRIVGTSSAAVVQRVDAFSTLARTALLDDNDSSSSSSSSTPSHNIFAVSEDNFNTVPPPKEPSAGGKGSGSGNRRASSGPHGGNNRNANNNRNNYSQNRNNNRNNNNSSNNNNSNSNSRRNFNPATALPRANPSRMFYPGQFYDPQDLNPYSSKAKPFFLGNRRKECPLSQPGTPEITHKNVLLLSKFVSESGKIIPRRLSGVSAKKQRELARAIKRARGVYMPHTYKMPHFQRRKPY